MWPRNRSVTWLCAWRPLNLNTHPAKFGGHMSCGWKNTMFLNCQVITGSNCHVPFWVGSPHPESAPCQVFSAMGLVNVNLQRFSFVRLPRYQNVTWLCGRGPLILNHQSAKCGVHRPCESEGITFFIYHLSRKDSINLKDKFIRIWDVIYQFINIVI